MTEYIKMPIECSGEYCGSCYFNFIMPDSDYYCGAFHDYKGVNVKLEFKTIKSDFLGDCKRCQQCLDAEIKE